MGIRCYFSTGTVCLQGEHGIYAMNIDGSNARRVAYIDPYPDQKRGFTRPDFSWSPDGRSITYVSDNDIYVVSIDTSTTTPSSTTTTPPSEPACADWAHREPCNGAIQLLRKYAAFGTWDRAGNPKNMAKLEEAAWQMFRRFYTAELSAEISQRRELVKDADERGALLERGGLLRIVRSHARIVSALPIDRELWSETAAHLRVEMQFEREFITGEVDCILEEYRMSMVRESPTESWLFDRGLFVPVESQATVGVCRS